MFAATYSKIFTQKCAKKKFLNILQPTNEALSTDGRYRIFEAARLETYFFQKKIARIFEKQKEKLKFLAYQVSVL